ncbi:MAK32 Protein MAK32 [Candida maltosa Xu316]
MTIFTTLGMFIIDENRYLDIDKPPEINIIGGAGTYAIVGARIISNSNQAREISGIIDKGSDFPIEVEDEIQTWETGVILRNNPTRLTTRGANLYHNGIRDFEYLTPKLQIQVDDILQYEDLKHSTCFHLICTIDRCESIIDKLNKENPENPPIFIYEPLPWDCIHERLDALKKLLPKIHIFTPNLDEAKLLLGITTTDCDPNLIAQEFTSFLKIPNSGTVLRCGAGGCLINTIDGTSIQLPAYHQNQKNVIDVTGGGNSFCGGFGMGFCLSKGNWLEAGICGNISSGCVIEKLGMPVVKGDTFNDKTFRERLKTYIDQNPSLKVNFDWIDV